MNLEQRKRFVNPTTPAARNRGLIFAAALLAGCAAEAAAEEIWAQPRSAVWSSPSAWLDGTPPPVGGALDLALRFENFGTSTFTATNDLGSPTRVNRITLLNDSPNPLTIDVASNSTIDLSGATPELAFGGLGVSSITGLWLDADAGVTRITGGGAGGLGIGSLSERTPGQALVIDAPAPSLDTGLITISSASFGGGLTLQQGTLRPGSASALGTGSVTINGGTIQPGTVTVPNRFVLNQDLTVVGGNLTLSGPVTSGTPSAGLALRPSINGSHARLTLGAAATYAGPTRTTTSLLTFSGAGSALNSSAFEISANSNLTLEASNGGNNRIGDSTPVRLQGSELEFVSPVGTTGTQTEKIGVLSSAGKSTITLSVWSAPVQLTAESLQRVGRGTFLFGGSNLGAPPGTSGASLFLSTPPTDLAGGGGNGPNISILPYAIGSNSGEGLVTYDAERGVRVLDLSSEYVTDLPRCADEQRAAELIRFRAH